MLIKNISKKWPKIFCGFLLVGALAGCNSSKLYGRLERLSPGISVHQILMTPQPVDWTEPNGQRLVVSWLLPHLKKEADELELHADIVFSKGQRDLVVVKDITRWNHWTYEHSNESISDRGSIVTYKIWITNRGQTIETFQHKLYREPIDPEALQDEVFF